MAVLKDLIVHGASRFLGDVFVNFIKAKDIVSDTGYFKKLTAIQGTIDDLTSTNLTTRNATVTALLDVQGDMHTNSWSNSNIATIDGSFYINPTSSSADGADVTSSSYTPTGVIKYENGNYTQLAVTGTFNTSQLNLDTATNVAWPANSYVIITGDVLVDNEWYPLGTIRGKLESQLAANANSKTISVIPIGATVIAGEVGNTSLTDGHGMLPQTLEAIRTAAPTMVTASPSTFRMRKIKVSMTSYGGTYQSPIGIFMTAMGSNNKTFLDIYGGAKNTTTIPSGSGALAEPTLRIGNLSGMPSVSGVTPAGWGIYTTNGFFTGTIVAKQGKIGSGNAAWTIGNDSNSGKAMIYTGTRGSADSAYISTGIGTESIAGSGTLNTTNDGYWAFTAGASFGVTTKGKLYANNAAITGTITAKNFSALDENNATRAVVNENGLIVYDGLGTGTDNIVARFGSTVVVGKDSISRVTIDSKHFGMGGALIYQILNDDNGLYSVRELQDIVTTVNAGTVAHTENSIHSIDTLIIYETTKAESNQTVFSMKNDVLSVKEVLVNDIIAEDSTYTVSGNDITFNTAPSNGAKVVIGYYNNILVPTGNNTLTFTDGTTGYIDITYETSAIFYEFSFGRGTNARADFNNSCVSIGSANTMDSYYGNLCNGYKNFLKGQFNFITGWGNSIKKGNYCYAEGYGTVVQNCSGSHVEGQSTVVNANYSHAEGFKSVVNCIYSHAEGYKTVIKSPATAFVSEWGGNHVEGFETTVSGDFGAHGEGYDVLASGDYGAHAEGCRTTASGDNGAHAEGRLTKATRNSSHAEGYYTTASGEASHAEGYDTIAYGQYSHAEGSSTQANSSYSHAEGSDTIAYGTGSHAQNTGTVATRDSQTVIGKYNTASSNDGTYSTWSTPDCAFIIGNGTSDSSRSNALTVDWNGVLSCRRPKSTDANCPAATNNEFASMFDLIYPVGAIYMSTNSTSPEYLFGGTWVQIEDRFLLAAGSAYTAGAMDGAATVTLTDAQMAHGHGFTQPTVNGGSCTITSSGGHSHTITTRYNTGKVASGSGTFQVASSGSSSTTGVSSIAANTGTHTHSVPAHTHSVSDGAVSNLSGASNTRTAHNNMPPYLVVYVWERTA